LKIALIIIGIDIADRGGTHTCIPYLQPPLYILKTCFSVVDILSKQAQTFFTHFNIFSDKTEFFVSECN
jgi:hypothetical protein